MGPADQVCVTPLVDTHPTTRRRNGLKLQNAAYLRVTTAVTDTCQI